MASFGGAAILPDNGVVDRLARFAVPHDGRLPLIGDTDRSQVACPYARLAENLYHRAHLRGKDLERVVLDPAALGVNLLELTLAMGDDVSIFAKEDGTGTGGSLIERENIGHDAP